MSFVRRIKYFLVHTLGYTNREAAIIIHSGKLEVNRKTITENIILNEEDEITFDNKIIRAAKEHLYIRFYKPVGYQSSLNKNVPDSLYEFFKEHTNLAIAGRLDKASEGLLLLSTDGKWIESIVNPLADKEKEYLVTLDKAPDENFISHFKNGVLLGDGITKPCNCQRTAEINEIKVILTEGRNRQIRRMCHKLGFKVERLLRTRIHMIELKALKPGEYEILKF